MAASRGQGAGLKRVLTKLQASVENGNYYEAHQMYRTLYFRYSSQGRYEELKDLLFDGAGLLLKHQQQGSGTDLAMLLVEVFNASNTPVTEENMGKVASIFKLIQGDCVERTPFAHAALKWSSKIDPVNKGGHPRLHQLIAITLWKEKNYVQSRYHFIHSTDGEGCAAMLVEYHIAEGYPCEVDLFITQAVLQYLCLKNKTTATIAFYSYAQNHPDVTEGPPFLKPLFNFIWFLLIAIESGKLAVFSILCERYEASINRDPTYFEYLDRIGQLFFGIPPPQAMQQGLLGNLLHSFFMDDNEDEAASEGLSMSMLRPARQAQNIQAEELD